MSSVPTEPESALPTWQRLGRAGLVVSIVYGPMQGPPHPRLGWSVTVFDPRTRESFQLPYEARDFAHAVQIAEIECRERGWYTGE